MRAMSAALKAHYQSAVTTIARCVRLILVNRQPRIVDITKANPGVVTTLWDHGFQTGEVKRIKGVDGMTEVNGNFYQVTVTGARSFSINADTSAFTAYLKGSWYGVAQKVLGFTSHVADLTISNVVYKSSLGADASAVASRSDLSVDNLDVESIIDDDVITTKDLEAGLYRGAEFELFEVNYKDLSQGSLILRTGNFGEITLRDQMYVAEGLGLMNFLQQQVGPLVSLTCRAQFGDKIKEPAGFLRLDTRFGCKVRLNPPTWLPNTAYTVVVPQDAALGSIVKPTVYNGRHFQCTTAGTSGATEPVWNNAIGGTTNDGSAVWTTVDALTKSGNVTGVTDRRTFSDTSRIEKNDRFTFGLLTWITGPNKGFATEVKSYLRTSYPIVVVNQGLKRFEISGDQTPDFAVNDVFTVALSTGNDGEYTVSSVSYDGPSNRTRIDVVEAIPDPTADGEIQWKPATFILRDKTLEDINIGDEYEVEVGCPKTLEACRDDFDNIHNMRAEPYVPGVKRALLYPDAK